MVMQIQGWEQEDTGKTEESHTGSREHGKVWDSRLQS